jgi:L-fucono-1,5-lactonase
LIVDAHQHFWDPGRADYPWMTAELAVIRRRFGPDDLAPLLRERGVDRTIVVQTQSSVEETRELLALAAATEFVAGVVGWVDLTSPSVAATIAELRRRPDGRYLVGVRHQVHDEDDPDWLLREDVQSGLAAVAEADLVYDLLGRPRELPAALETTRRLPELRFVIDHLAKPPIAAGELEPWAGRMAPFADLANVSCKLSGLVTEAEWSSWTRADLVPYVNRAEGWFGDERLLFGSDWPVCLLATSYGKVFDAYIDALGDLSRTARERIVGLNAVRVYGLEEP